MLCLLVIHISFLFLFVCVWVGVCYSLFFCVCFCYSFNFFLCVCFCLSVLCMCGCLLLIHIFCCMFSLRSCEYGWIDGFICVCMYVFAYLMHICILVYIRMHLNGYTRASQAQSNLRVCFSFLIFN